MEHFGKE